MEPNALSCESQRLDRVELPDLEQLTGIFGSRRDEARRDADDDLDAGLLPCLWPFSLSR